MKFKVGDIVKFNGKFPDIWVKRIDEVIKVGCVESGTRNECIEWIALKSYPVIRPAKDFEIYKRKEDI